MCNIGQAEICLLFDLLMETQSLWKLDNECVYNFYNVFIILNLEKNLKKKQVYEFCISTNQQITSQHFRISLKIKN